MLKLLNTDSENPYLVWDMSTRAELTEFLENERTSSVRTGTCDPAFGSNFKFTAHENELVVGGIFVRIFNQQSMFQLRVGGSALLHPVGSMLIYVLRSRSGSPWICWST